MSALPKTSLATLLLTAATVAHAAPGGIVLETYAGPRSADAPRLLAPVFDELAKHGFASGPDGVGARLQTATSSAARTAAGLPVDFADSIERGYKSWIKGDFKPAIATLAPLVELAHENVAAIAQDQKLRAQMQRGLIALALCNQRLGNTSQATAIMAELVRSYPDATISRANQGPEVFTLYDNTRKQLAAAPHGKLVLHTSDATTSVFIDERFEKNGDVTRDDLIAGDYRVYVALGSHEGRVYHATVAANTTTSIDVDWAFNDALHTTPNWTGFSFSNQADQVRSSAPFAARVAKSIGATAVAVMSIESQNGHASVTGSLVSIENGHEIRRAHLPLDIEPSSQQLHALGAFLAGDSAADGVVVELSPAAPPRITSNEKPVFDDEHDGVLHPHYGTWKYGLAITGLAAVGAGIEFLHLNNTCSSSPGPGQLCPRLYDTTTLGYVALGAGAAFIAGSVYMFVMEHRHHRQKRTAAIIPTAGGAMIYAATSF